MGRTRFLQVFFLIIVIVSGISFLRQCDKEFIGNIYYHVIGTSCPSERSASVKKLKMDDLFQADTFPRYFHPHNSSVLTKKEFKLEGKIMETARKLIGDLVLEYNTRPVEMDCVPFLPTLVPVTAISSNHFNEFIGHITPAEKIKPHEKIVVYDLGLSLQEIDQLNRTPYVDYRKFNFSRFPEHVKNLHTYAFKPLIIAETLAEFGGVMWMDASVVLARHYSYQYLMDRMIKKKSGFLYYVSPSRHSIVFATHKHMFDYLPMKGAKETKANMAQATGMILFNTEYMLKHVMKWAILCSLHDDCIAPKGAKLECDFSLPDHVFGGCHRYDQSMFAILVSNAYNDEMHRYRLSGWEYPASVQRTDEKKKK